MNGDFLVDGVREIVVGFVGVGKAVLQILLPVFDLCVLGRVWVLPFLK